MRTINYYRVSTEKQGRSGLGLDAQRSAVEAFCAARGCETIGEYVEIESGKRDDRPELAKALAQCRLTGATLIIAKLDRLSRNVAFLAALQDSGARFLCADMPDMSELTLHIVAAMAQNERKMISARTKAALAQAKARGVTLGNPLGAKAFGDKISEGRAASRAAREARAQAFAQEVRPIIDDIRSAGPLSLSQIAAELDRRNILPPQGGRWNKATLSRVIARTD
jgi:DNA invertase Pin-like site-specific DNA recombinase